MNVPDQSLHVPDARLGLNTDQLRRQSEQQIPRTSIAWRGQRDFSKHLEDGGHPSTKPVDQSLVPFVPERIAHEMKTGRELEPKERRDRGDVDDRRTDTMRLEAPEVSLRPTQRARNRPLAHIAGRPR